MEKENNKNLNKKLNIKKVLFNILMVSLIILALGFAINLKYAIGYLFILIIHESGHYITAKFLKIGVVFGGFTPVGAYIIHKNPKNCKENALIAIGGPLFGGILGLILSYRRLYIFSINFYFNNTKFRKLDTCKSA